MVWSLLLTAVVAAIAYALLSSCASLLRRKFIQKHTALMDIPFLATPRPTNHKIQGTAVVCGGRQVTYQ